MDKQILERLRKSFLDLYSLEILDGVRDILSGENSFLLLLLSFSSTPLTASFIAERLNVTKGRITALISSLLDKGEIELALDLKDRRKTLVSLTDKGRKRIESKVNEVNGVLEYLIQDLQDEEITVLVSLLNRIKERGKQLWNT